MGLLVGRILAQHIVPATPGAHHLQAALAQPRARGECPFLVGRVGQQLAAVRGVIAALEALDVGAHLGGRGELDQTAPKHDGAAIAKRAARVTRSLVQVRRGSVRAELRPQHLEHLVTRHAVAGSERKQLHQIRRAPLRPRVSRDRSRVHQHFEASEQPDLELPHTNQPYSEEGLPERRAPQEVAFPAAVRRDAEQLVSTRWDAFLESEPQTRGWSCASYVAALDAEEAAATELASPALRIAACGERDGTSPSPSFRRDRRGAQLHACGGAPVGRPTRSVDPDPPARGATAARSGATCETGG